MNKKELMEMLQEVINGLTAGGIISKNITISDKTILMGAGSDLDSIAFVTFFMEIEEKLSGRKGEDVYLILDEIIDLDDGQDALNVETLINYILKLMA